MHVNETTNDVLSRALDQLAIAVSFTELDRLLMIMKKYIFKMYIVFILQVAKSNCQMWVKFSREGAGLQLLGKCSRSRLILAEMKN